MTKAKRPSTPGTKKKPASPSAHIASLASQALAYRVLGMSWETVTKQLGVKGEQKTKELVRQALGLGSTYSDEQMQEEIDRLSHDALYARTQPKAMAGDTPSIRTAAKLLATRPRRTARPSLDPLRSAVRRGLARGLGAKRILAEFSECKKSSLADIKRIIKDELVIPAQTPQAQRERRVAELEAVKRDAPDNKTLMSALRILVKLDGSLEPPLPSLYDTVWALCARLADHPLPEAAVSPRRPAGDAERRLWRARLQRLSGLLQRAADDVSAFRRLGDAPVGAVIMPNDKTADRLGRMSRINLYAQEHAAVALSHAATNPAATPGQRAEVVSRLVGTLAMNHPAAEVSEWANELVERMKADADPAAQPGGDGAGAGAAE